MKFTSFSRASASFLVCGLSVNAAFAQGFPVQTLEPLAIAAPASPALRQDNAASIALIKGDKIIVNIVDSITSKTAKKGDLVKIQVGQDYVSDDYVVVPKGSVGQATISQVKKRGGFGKSGLIALDFNWVEMPGAQRLSLDGGMLQNGVNTFVVGSGSIANIVNSGSALGGVGGAGIASVGLLAIGALVQGQHAETKADVPHQAFIKDDLVVATAGLTKIQLAAPVDVAVGSGTTPSLSAPTMAGTLASVNAFTPAAIPAEATLGATGAMQTLALPIATIAMQQVILPPDTEIAVTPNEDISSKQLREGDTFSISTMFDVMHSGFVVIPKNTQGKATVAWRTGKGAFGKSAKMDISFNSLDLGNGKTLALTGKHRQEGEGNTGAAVGAIVAAGVFGAFVTGRSANIAHGMQLSARTGETLTFAIPSDAKAVPQAEIIATQRSTPAS